MSIVAKSLVINRLSRPLLVDVLAKNLAWTRRPLSTGDNDTESTPSVGSGSSQFLHDMFSLQGRSCIVTGGGTGEWLKVWEAMCIASLVYDVPRSRCIGSIMCLSLYLYAFMLVVTSYLA
jgi:hypothetical protein